MENQKRICVAICFGSSNHFTGLFLRMLHMKFGFDWLSGFREEVV